MPPPLALGLWLILLLALLVWDPARQPGTSLALWVPLTWMFIIASRLPSQWFGGTVSQVAEAALEEGNPLDRIIYFVLILASFGILMLRSFRWGNFFAHNAALTAFLAFGLLSVLWSDFAFVAFKRWFRDLGNYLVILVVVSDLQPLEAIRAVLRHLAYLLVPLSILLIKYYPQLGIQYSVWTGAAEHVGATTSKNMLGVACLVSGIFFFWDTVARWPQRRERRTQQIILVNIAFMAMTLWLLDQSDSATSRVCLILGCLVISAAHSKFFKHRPHLLRSLLFATICLYLTLAFGFGLDLNAELAGAVGRDPTLTGRSTIWDAVLSVHTNRFLGTGYESFWLGPRLQKVWEQTGPGINEAHNGYLEVYLNLGLIGLGLLLWFLISSYRAIGRRLKPFSILGSVSLALWAITPFYNVTEAAFKGQLMWIIFLLGAIVVPEKVLSRRQTPVLAHARAGSQVLPFPANATGTHPTFDDWQLEIER